MALSTCSGRDEGYKLVVQDRSEAGMRELVCFTQHLLEAVADPDAHGKIRERIEASSQEMSAAEEELGRQLEIVDATTQELVAKKKSLQDEQEQKKENLERLRIELNSCRGSEREAREMLDGANRQLGQKQAELQRQRAEAERNRLTRDIGIGLMFIPVLGTIAGSIMVGCGQVALDAAKKAAGEAQEAVNQHRNEASSYAAEVCRYEEQERQVEAEIAANEQRLAQIDAEQRELAVLQGEIVALQNGLRKCTTLVNGLAGKANIRPKTQSRCEEEKENFLKLSQTKAYKPDLQLANYRIPKERVYQGCIIVLVLAILASVFIGAQEAPARRALPPGEAHERQRLPSAGSDERVGISNSLLAAKGPNCPDGWVGFLGKCYYFSETEGNWTYSQSHCSALGASLAVTDTFRDLVFMLRYKGLFDHWIGLWRDQEGQPWKWPDGTEFNNL